MAIATTTAATIAAGAALAGTATSAAMSFSQASKQNRAANDAKRDAKESMDEVNKRLEINPYESMSLFKDIYEKQRLAGLSSGAQVIEAAKEGGRGAAESAGKVVMGQNEIQSGISDAESQRLSDIQDKILGERARLNNLGIGIGLQSAEGAQKAAANYEALANKAQMEGWQGVGSAISQAGAMVPLYAGTPTTGTASAQPLDSGIQSQLVQGVVGNDGGLPLIPSLNPGQAAMNAAAVDQNNLNQFSYSFNPFNLMGNKKF